MSWCFCVFSNYSKPERKLISSLFDLAPNLISLEFCINHSQEYESGGPIACSHSHHQPTNLHLQIPSTSMAESIAIHVSWGPLRVLSPLVQPCRIALNSSSNCLVQIPGVISICTGRCPVPPPFSSLPLSTTGYTQMSPKILQKSIPGSPPVQSLALQHLAWHQAALELVSRDRCSFAFAKRNRCPLHEHLRLMLCDSYACYMQTALCLGVAIFGWFLHLISI